MVTKKTASKPKAGSVPPPLSPPATDPNVVKIQAPAQAFPAVAPLDKAALVGKLTQALGIIGSTYPVGAKSLIQEVIDELKK